MLRRILALSSFPLLIACQPSSPPSSSLDHTLGQTSRSRSALSACKPGDSKDPAIAYLQSLFQKLVAANAGTFQWILAPEHFCLQLDADPTINGTAYIENGEIHLTKGLILAADHDADIAAVLAHELAHITMDHRYELEHDKVMAGSRVNELRKELTGKEGEYRRLKATYFPALRAAFQADESVLDRIEKLKNATWISYSVKAIRQILAMAEATEQQRINLLDESDSLRGQLAFEAFDDPTWNNIEAILERSDRELKPVRNEITELNTSIRNLPRDEFIQDGVGAAKNWKEQEADEVGYEFYLRAGFRPDRFTSVHNILMAQSRSDGECTALLQRGELPPRGSASHPSSCWRIHNINQREAMAHADAYKPFLSNSLLSISAGQLETIKKGL